MTYPAFFRGLIKTGMMLFFLAALSACNSTPVVQQQQYDFGPLPANAIETNNQSKLQLNLTEITAPVSLDSNAMLYRLQYDNVQALKAYSIHKWSMSPAQMLTQRLKASLAASGHNILTRGDGAGNLPSLHIELDEFSQIFSSASQSHAQLNLRANLVKANKLIAQKNFEQKIVATSADAPGGARAMREAADAIIADIQTWLAALPLK